MQWPCHKPLSKGSENSEKNSQGFKRLNSHIQQVDSFDLCRFLEPVVFTGREVTANLLHIYPAFLLFPPLSLSVSGSLSSCRLCQACVGSKMLNHYLLFRDLPYISRATCQSWFRPLHSNYSGEILQAQETHALCTHTHTHMHHILCSFEIVISLQLWFILQQQMWEADWQEVNPLVDRC